MNLVYISVIKYLLIIFGLIFYFIGSAQNQGLTIDKPIYDRQEEIINKGKRYRIHNNYLSLGGGFLNSSIRKDIQKSINVDYQFHIRRQHFQTGLVISGNAFTGNNNSQLHIGYGLRKETQKTNLAFFIGITGVTGVQTISDSLGIKPLFYDGYGAYSSIQLIKKITYDIGFGIEFFGETSQVQNIIGAKMILFFSSSFRGNKRNFNPHVKSENKR